MSHIERFLTLWIEVSIRPSLRVIGSINIFLYVEFVKPLLYVVKFLIIVSVSSEGLTCKIFWEFQLFLKHYLQWIQFQA